MSWGSRSLWEETKALCDMLPIPHPARTACPAQRRHCKAGPSSQWGRGRRNGHWVQSGSGGSRSVRQGPRGTARSQNKPGLPPMSVRQRRGGFGGNLGSPTYHCRTQLSGEGQALPLGSSRAVPEAGQGPGPVPSGSHLDLVVLGIGKLEGVCLHRAGHRGPAACLGRPPLFIQALPRGPALRQHLHQLPPSIHLSIVAAAPAATPACSPVPARGHVSRCAGTLSHQAGLCLSHWAQPSAYPVGAPSTGWRA